MVDSMAMYGTKVYSLGWLGGPGTLQAQLGNGAYFQGVPGHAGRPDRSPLGIGNRIRLLVSISLQDWGCLTKAAGFEYWGILPRWVFKKGLKANTAPGQCLRERTTNSQSIYDSKPFQNFVYNDANMTVIDTDATHADVKLLDIKWSVIKFPTIFNNFPTGTGVDYDSEVISFSVPLIAAADFADWQMIIISTNPVAFNDPDYVSLSVLVGANAQ